MNVPTFIDLQWTKEDGYLTNDSRLFEDELNQALQNALSDNGWTVPQQTAAQIAENATFQPDGTIWYCTDAVPPCYVGLISGSLVKFTTTPFP